MAIINMTTKTIKVAETTEELKKEIWGAQINFITVTEIINNENKEFNPILINFHFIIEIYD